MITTILIVVMVVLALGAILSGISFKQIEAEYNKKYQDDMGYEYKHDAESAHIMMLISFGVATAMALSRLLYCW